MKLHYLVALGGMLALPALGQAIDPSKPPPNPAITTSKQPTQGAPPGFKPQQYGEKANKQQSAGAPVGYEARENRNTKQ